MFLAALLNAVVPVQAARISEKDLRQHIEILASDAFEGRTPGTPGEQKTVDYVTKAWGGIKLVPAGRAGFVDPVALVQRGAGTGKITYSFKNQPLKFVSDDILLRGRLARYTKQDVAVIYGGYGVKADGSAIDNVAGKAVMILLERPDFVAPEKAGMSARMKALQAAGAESVIFVAIEQKDWAAMRRRLLSKPISLQSRDSHMPLEVIVSSEYAVAMLTAAGRDWDKLRAAAKNKDYAGEALGIKMNADVTTDVRQFQSANIIGKIPGKKSGSGAILFLAHWDHLGYCAPNDKGDDICNGAVDNASGIAVLTEVAKALAKKRHDRDIYFLATTAEESGLLGAYAFAENPALPLKDIIASFNLDTIAIAPAGAKVTIIGRGLTPLDPHIEAVAKAQKRAVEASDKSNAFLERQDGWALWQRGVPSFMVGGSFADPVLLEKFLGDVYHGPDDEVNEKMNLAGAREDADLHVALGEYFASTRKIRAKAP